MLTFLHLSDIHFKSRDGGTQFDLDAQLRRPLTDDIVSRPAGGANYDGMLISGDIAFGGKKDEYDRAKAWFNEIYARAKIPPQHTYMVPGNHDVDRAIVVPGGVIWNNHVLLRKEENGVLRRQMLQFQLTQDPACDPLSPLGAYNEFAQGYDCRSTKAQLAWVHDFPMRLDDGSILRIHGLNSAITSDASDIRANLYVSEFQTQQLARASGVVDLLMCHHPPHWLLDHANMETMLTSYVKLALFGHEHNHRSHQLGQTIQLFAGAVHPAARDPNWLPTFHVLQVRVDGTGENRRLIVRIYSRELRGQTFVPRMSNNGDHFEEYNVSLPEWMAPVTLPRSAEKDKLEQPEDAMTATSRSEPPATPFSSPPSASYRELLVEFHRLSTPVRYNIATKLDLLRDGDDVSPQLQWDLVFQRAKEENQLAALWREVAFLVASMAKRPNPFQSQ